MKLPGLALDGLVLRRAPVRHVPEVDGDRRGLGRVAHGGFAGSPLCWQPPATPSDRSPDHTAESANVRSHGASSLWIPWAPCSVTTRVYLSPRITRRRGTRPPGAGLGPFPLTSRRQMSIVSHVTPQPSHMRVSGGGHERSPPSRWRCRSWPTPTSHCIRESQRHQATSSWLSELDLRLHEESDLQWKSPGRPQCPGASSPGGRDDQGPRERCSWHRFEARWTPRRWPTSRRRSPLTTSPGPGAEPARRRQDGGSAQPGDEQTIRIPETE